MGVWSLILSISVLSRFGDRQGRLKQLKDDACAVTVRHDSDWGRLGNKLYRYISGEGAAHQLSCIWCPPAPLIADLEKAGIECPLHSPCESRTWTQIYEKNAWERPQWKMWNGIRSLSLGTYLQSWEYHRKHRSALRYNRATQAACDAAVVQACPSGVDVSMHVRGGDAIGHNIGPRSEHFLPHVKGCVVVVSDEPRWVRQNLPSSVHFLQHSPAVDMCIAGTGRKLVLTAGTFDLFAAYFRRHPDAQVIMDRNTFRWDVATTNSALDSYAPKEWITPIMKCKGVIVTAYFHVLSKHTHAEYMEWAKHMLSMGDCMVVFTTKEFVNDFKRIRGSRPTHIVPMSLDTIPVAMEKSTAEWKEQLRIDPERNIHRSYQLFWIWLSKPWFVTRAIALQEFDSNVWAWVDIGSFRDSAPKKLFVYPEAVPENAMLFNAWRPHVLNPRPGDVKDTFTDGSMAAGTAKAWHAYFTAFMKVMRSETMLYEDQYIIEQTCRKNHGLCKWYNSYQWFGLKLVLATPKRKSPQASVCQNTDFAPESKVSVWTMLTEGKGYVEGALRIAHGIRTHTTTKLDLVVMEQTNKPLNDEARGKLALAGWKRCVVRRIPPLDEAHTLPRFRDQFTKFHAWGMVMYNTLLYLDADTLPVRSVDPLLRLKLGSAKIGVARDYAAGEWKQGFNMGVFLIQPSAAEYSRLLQLQRGGKVKAAPTMAEQGFLNQVYRDQWHDIGFEYNANLAIYAQDRTYWDKHFSKVRIIHYTMSKPWACEPAYRGVCDIWKTSYDVPLHRLAPERRVDMQA